MNLKSIKLDNNSYHEYLEGKEVYCSPSTLESKSLREGEHVMVYKDTVAASTSISVPKAEMQSEYIGIEGEVMRVPPGSGGTGEVVIRKL